MPIPLDPNPPDLAGSKLVAQEVIKLETPAFVELYILDATEIGGETIYFHAGTNKYTTPIVYQGITYNPIPVEARGFEFKSKGELPRPRIKFSNIGGFMKNLVLAHEDLVGALIIRRRVFADRLDGSAGASPTAHPPDDVYSISRKVSENRYVVEFELETAFEVEGVKLPRRQIMAAYCPRYYRGDGCFFAEKRFVANKYNVNPTDLVRYCGYYDNTRQYQEANVVSVVEGASEGMYILSDALAAGSSPAAFPLIWIEVQRWWGEYDPADTYVLNDVVFIYSLKKPDVKQVFRAITNVSINTRPPNETYWEADVCSKVVSACKRRFDPLGLRYPIPFGGFPGTARVPEAV